MNDFSNFYYPCFYKDLQTITKKYGNKEYYIKNYYNENVDVNNNDDKDSVDLFEDSFDEDDEFCNTDNKNKKIMKPKLEELNENYLFYYFIELNDDTYEKSDKYLYKIIIFDKGLRNELEENEFNLIMENNFYSINISELYDSINDLKFIYDKNKSTKMKLFVDFILALFNKKFSLIDKMISDGDIDYTSLWYYFDKKDQYFKINFYGKDVIFKHKSYYYDEDGIGKKDVFGMNGEIFLVKNNEINSNRFYFEIEKFAGKRKINSFKISTPTTEDFELFESKNDKILNFSKNYHYVKIYGKQFIFSDSVIEMDRNEKAIVDNNLFYDKYKKNFKAVSYYLDHISEENYNKEKFLLFPFVGVYNLGLTKTWGMVHCDDISLINYDNTIFDKLVVDNEVKDIIEILVSSHGIHKKYNDYIHNKGLGLLFLLYGPPGVGKTLTAEATSEYLEKPLYTINVGDLNFECESLELKLKEIDDYCRVWKCILLFDEADIFLEERDFSNLSRNAIVSTFLKFLEYNESIIFLTTNRMNTIDVAVKSRINLIIPYENLNKQKRIKIWTHLIEFWNLNITKNDIDKLSNIELNGREIRNYLKTVLLILDKKNLELNYDNLNNYIKKIMDLNKDMTFTKLYN